MVRYYGYYSNVCRGQRKKADKDGLVACLLQPEELSKGYLKNWAKLIQKIYEVDPLTCPKGHGQMAIIAFIQAEDVIEKILQRRTSPQASRSVARQAEAPTQGGQIEAPEQRALDRLC